MKKIRMASIGENGARKLILPACVFVLLVQKQFAIVRPGRKFCVCICCLFLILRIHKRGFHSNFNESYNKTVFKNLGNNCKKVVSYFCAGLL